MHTRVGRTFVLMAAVIAVPGCTVAGLESVAPSATLAASTPIATSPEPSPSGRPREPLRFPESQSYGVVDLELTSPTTASASLPMACEWKSPTEVGWYYLQGQTTIAGELVTFDVNPETPDPAYLIRIWRDDAAAYQVTPEAGSAMLNERANDGSSGRITFEGIGPDAESADPGPIPIPLEHWIRPFGGDPAFTTISGTATWSCEPPPSTVPGPEPEVSDDPGRTPPPIPDVVLIGEDRRDNGERLCGSFDIDGFTAWDDCGISFLWIGPEHTVTVAAGGRLRFALPKGWHFESWSIGWATQAEAERFRFTQPDTFVGIDHGETTTGRVLEIDAPPPGEWDVEFAWTAARGADSATFPSFFRVLVER